MKTLFLTLAIGLSSLTAISQTDIDSIAAKWERELNLNEVVVVAKRPVMRQQDDRLVYLVKNDPYAKGLDGISLLDRIPRVSSENGSVSVAGKGNVRYIIDGVLMELDASAMKMRLEGLRAEGIEKIELLTTPPPKYAVEPNAAYISITTRNETLGTRGNIYGSLSQWDRLREYASASVSHTTRKVEMSLDGSFQNYYSTNDNTLTYLFPDKSRESYTRTHIHDILAGVNALFRYRFTPDINAGVIANYKYGHTTSDGANTTDYGPYAAYSSSSTVSRPNNAVTLTGFLDWMLGGKGEKLELTYNYFNRHSPKESEIVTVTDTDIPATAIDECGENDYRFHAGRADLKLPFTWAQVETGASYTDILHQSENYMTQVASGIVDETANLFDYREKIAAAYFSASRSLGNGFWGKASVRYEHTWTKGELRNAPQVSRHSYGRLFPTLNLSWRKDGIGSFNLSYSMGMGRPNLWDLNPFRYYSSADEYSAGNPELKPTIYNNAEINYYGLGGLYAVLYTSFAKDAITHVRRVDSNGVISTTPFNCLSTNKTGLYATYKRSIFDWWEVNVGGEVFHTWASGNLNDFRDGNMEDWSGKIEVSSDWMLNRQKTLKFNVRFSNLFPWEQNMVSYESLQLLSMTLRYALLDNRLNLRLTANDIFGWNKTKSVERLSGYTVRHRFDGNTAYVLLGIGYSFGGKKVNGVWRNSKEEQSGRTR